MPESTNEVTPNIDGIVTYQNELNKLPLNALNAKEANVFLAAMYKLQNANASSVMLRFSELQDLANLQMHMTKAEFARTLKSMLHKLAGTTVELKGLTEDQYTILSVIQSVDVDMAKSTATFKFADEIVPYLNNVTEQFTTFELSEYMQLTSVYMKELYRMLKQWRTVGICTVSVADLRTRLGIPDSYPNARVMQMFTSPRNKKEMERALPGFTATPVKAPTHGSPITHVSFTWTPEKADQDRAKRQTSQAVASTQAAMQAQQQQPATETPKPEPKATTAKQTSKPKQPRHNSYNNKSQGYKHETMPDWEAEREQARKAGQEPGYTPEDARFKLTQLFVKNWQREHPDVLPDDQTGDVLEVLRDTQLVSKADVTAFLNEAYLPADDQD